MLRHGLWASLTLAAAGLATVSACGGNVSTGGGGDTSTSSSSGSTSTGTSGTTSTSSSSSGGNCDPSSCQPGFICCGGACVNPLNDIHHCGTCGNACTG